MQKLSKIKKWQSAVTATAKKKDNSVQRDVLVVCTRVCTYAAYIILASLS